MCGNKRKIKAATILVTGGIGSGKSVVCGMLEESGIPIYNSDERAKSLYERDTRLVDAVAGCFGTDIIGADGQLDKTLLAARAFASEENISRLNSIVHPAVLRDFVAWREHCDSPVVVMESALAGTIPKYREEIDCVVLVCADEKLRLDRACQRDGNTSEAIHKRMSRQSYEGLCADYVIVNNGTLSELRAKLEPVLLFCNSLLH